MKVGDRVKNINSGYMVEEGPYAGDEVNLGIIVSITDYGDAGILWDGCEHVYFVPPGEFDLAKKPREFWVRFNHNGELRPCLPNYDDAFLVREVIE